MLEVSGHPVPISRSSDTGTGDPHTVRADGAGYRQRMSTRVKLADLKRVSPKDLAHCSGYVWHVNSLIGKGSVSEIYLGWNSDGSKEVAVKVVRKDVFRQDPKTRENLDREIRILKLLRGCEYVIHLFHVEEMKHFIVLVMELCEYDLNHLVKMCPFKEDDITLFLHQFAQAMKALRDHNIVHRDLNPGNILIKNDPTTGKMKFKLADFGYARHFRDVDMKPIEMTSLAGTPIFMAPEALRCVFNPGEHYDDKVDIWSIGALLYNIIVGEVGFYAQLQDIPRILKHKGDAIAFKSVPHSRKINYIMELPASVHDQFSERFREKMNHLLRLLLKLDPQERMTFPEFFQYIDDLLTSGIEVVNLLHGTSFKIIFDPKMTMRQLLAEIESLSAVSVQKQLIFSADSDHFLAPAKETSLGESVTELLKVVDGDKVNVILYLLPMGEVQADGVEPDFSCLSKLLYCVDNVDECVQLIVEHTFTTEVVHAINDLHTQQKRQLAGIQEFNKFCLKVRELMDPGQQSGASQLGLEARARGTLAVDWLMADLDQLASTSPPDSFQQVLKAQIQAVNQLTLEIDNSVQEITRLQQSCQEGLRKGGQCDLVEDDLAKVAATISEEVKKLPKMRKDDIHPTCRTILEDYKSHITEITEKVHTALRASLGSILMMWEMPEKEGELRQKCALLEKQLIQALPQSRASLLRSMTTEISAGRAQYLEGVAVPRSVERKPIMIPRAEKKNDPIQQDLFSGVEQIESDIKSQDKEVVVKKKELIEDRHARKLARGRLNVVEKKADEAQENVAVLIKESNEIWNQLKKKQHDLELFQELQKQKTRAVQEDIADKSKEIQELRQELEVLQEELSSKKGGKIVLELQREHRREMEELHEQHEKKKRQLEQKKDELRELKEQHEKEKGDLEGLIKDKTLEIEKTRQESESNEAKLQSEKEKADSYQKQLQHANIELATTSDRVQYLEEALQKWEAQLEQQWGKLHEIAMQAINQENETQMKVVNRQVQELRSQMKQTQTQPEVPGQRADTWEYRVFTKNSADIISSLATVKLARRVADELHSAGIIGKNITELAYNTGPDILEHDRVRPMIKALEDKIQQNPEKYHEFRSILQKFGADAETAINYMPEKANPHMLIAPPQELQREVHQCQQVAKTRMSPEEMHLVPVITAEPKSLQNITPGRPATFLVKATGKNLTYTWHHQTTKQLRPSDKKVVGNTPTLQIDKVEPTDVGYYVCTISNPTGGTAETKPVELTTKTVYTKMLSNRNIVLAVLPVAIVVIAVLIGASRRAGVWKPWNSSPGIRKP